MYPVSNEMGYMNKIELEQKVKIYREIRKRVWQEATKTANTARIEHHHNQSLYKEFVLELCSKCNLDNHLGTDQQAAQRLWHIMWTVIRYAGIKSNTATNEIRTIKHVFDDYTNFLSSEWDIDTNGHELIAAGKQAMDFKCRRGLFQDCLTVSNWPKNARTVKLARALNRFMQTKSPSTPVIDFITGGQDKRDVWGVLDHLQEINYRAEITGTHLMMDLGFEVIKPDIILSRLFLSLGWTHEVIPSLPKDISLLDLEGLGKYGSKYKYTKRSMFQPVIELARQITSQISPQELKIDIGWVSNNPMREFDFFMVKYGQQPEPSRGIVRTLFNPELSSHALSSEVSNTEAINIKESQGKGKPIEESFMVYALISEQLKKVFLSTHVNFHGKSIPYFREDIKTWNRSPKLQSELNQLSDAPDLKVETKYQVASQDDYNKVKQAYTKREFSILGRPTLRKKNETLE